MSAVIQINEATKACGKCGEIKTLSGFMKTTRNGYIQPCKKCRNEIAREKYRTKPPKIDKEARREANKKYLDGIYADPRRHARLLANKKKFNSSVSYYENYFIKKFGITYDEVKAMFQSQMRRCANRGCGKEIVFYHENKDGRAHPNRACLDHDHETGRVRALLCISCNTILGTLETKENLILGLMEYKMKFKQQHKG